MIYNELSGEALDLFFESFVRNESDVYYNKDKFDNKEINICFITGLSGSGKSTMAKNMSNKNIEHYELDDVLFNFKFSYEKLKEYGDLIYTFFKGPGKKYKYESYKELQTKLKGVGEDQYEVPMFRDFVDYSIKYAKSHRDKQYVIEGVELLYFKINPQKLKNCAVYIKGTSIVKSAYRATKRDCSDTDNKNKLNKAKLVSHMMFKKIKDIKYYTKTENMLKQWRIYFKKLSESQEENINETALTSKERNNLDTSDFGLPKQRKYPLIDAEHVKKAIQFFRYCPEKDRKELAINICKEAKKYNIDVNEKIRSYVYKK